MKPRGLPSLKHLTGPEWWAKAREIVRRAKLAAPSARAERRRLEKFGKVMVREYLRGVLFAELCQRHRIGWIVARRIIEASTTPEQRRRVNLDHHLRREKKRQARQKQYHERKKLAEAERAPA